MNHPPGTGIRIVGLLGGVGSGKSAAAGFLAELLPGRLLDADAEVGRMLENPEIGAQVEESLGPGLLNTEHEVDRHVLGEIVFHDPNKRKSLEEFLHPLVREFLWSRLAELEKSGGDWAVLDVPLLLEGGLSEACDFMIFVDTPADDRRRRACSRHGWEASDWEARESAQTGLDNKQAAADAILGNVGTLEDLKVGVEGLLARLRELPPRPLRDRWPR